MPNEGKSKIILNEISHTKNSKKMKLVRMDSLKTAILLQNDYIEVRVTKTGSPYQIER